MSAFYTELEYLVVEANRDADKAYKNWKAELSKEDAELLESAEGTEDEEGVREYLFDKTYNPF